MPPAILRQMHGDAENGDTLALARLITDHASDAIFLLDAEGRTTFANPAAEAMFGWSAAELQGRKLHDIVHYQRPDGAPFPMSECPLGHVFSTGASLRLHEDVFFDKGGNEVPVACSNAAIMNEGAVRGSVLIVRDISERRRAERQRQILLDELNHRAKNMLAVVQSIIHQSLKAPEYEEARTVLAGRIYALAAGHDILVRGEGIAAAIGSLAQLALDPFSGDGRIAYSGPELNVSPRIATALAMTLHELGTNAVKYGALSNTAGRVTLQWNRETSPEGDMLVLTWRETGGPPVTPPAHRGFGSRMIQALLGGEAGGSVSVDYDPEGLRCTLKAPLQD